MCRTNTCYAWARYLLISPFLTDRLDRTIWRWMLLSKVCLHTMLHAGSTTFQGHQLIWQTWDPLRVKIFMWLAFRRRHWIADRWRRHGLEARDNLLPLWSGTRDNRPYHCLVHFHQGTLAPHCPGARKASSTATANHQVSVATATRHLDRTTAKRFQQLIHAGLMAGMEGTEHPLLQGIAIHNKRATLDNQSPSRSVDQSKCKEPGNASWPVA